MTLQILWSCLFLVQFVHLTLSQCASDTPIDYLFVVDSSDTIGSTNFGIVTDWISTIVTSYISSDSRVGFITFDDSASVSAIASGTASSFSSRAESLLYTGGEDRNLDIALDEAVSAFDTAGTSRQRQMIIFMDGQPTSIICASYSETIKQANINTYIVGTSDNFLASAVNCLLYDVENDVVSLPTYSAAKITNIVSNMTDMICPLDYQLRITEVKLQSSYRYVEIYNYGKDVPLSNIELSYMFDGAIDSGETLSYGQYLVVYNSSLTTPSCTSCGALFYACDGSPCFYNGGTLGYSATNFQIEIISLDTTDVIENVRYDSSDYWVIIPSGFSHELKSSGYSSSKGYNWAQSCTSAGTPGEEYSDCGDSCTVSYCQLNGASGATCDSNPAICSCNQVRYTRTDGTCRRLAAPSNCVASVYKITVSGNEQQIIRFEWDPANMDENIRYQISLVGLSGRVTVTARQASYTTQSFDFDTVAASSSAGILWAYDSSTASSSANTTCSFSTLTPSLSPTDAPTATPSAGPTQGPTKAPTFEDPKVWITGDICEEDRCDCNGAGYLSCTGTPITREFIASEEAQFVTIRRYPGNYNKNTTIYWRLLYLGESDSQGNLTDDSTATTTTTLAPNATQEGITPSRGNLTIMGDTDARISLLIRLYTQIDGTPYRVYKLQLYECEVKNATCYTVYPSNLTMIVDISGGESTSTSSREREIPQWLWWVVGAIILFLFILAWFVYKFWWAKRQTDKQIQETEEDLDHALQENALGFGHELDDGNVGFNPLNTSAPKGYKAPDLNLNPQPNSDQDGFDNIAKTDIERFEVRQEFGPQMGNAPRNQENEPLL